MEKNPFGLLIKNPSRRNERLPVTVGNEEDSVTVAYEYTQKKFFFNKERWAEREDSAARYQLVWHEYCRAMGYSDDNYETSSRLSRDLESLHDSLFRGRVSSSGAFFSHESPQ